MEWNNIENSIPPKDRSGLLLRESEYSRHWVSFLGVYEGNKWEREICHHDGCFWAMPPKVI